MEYLDRAAWGARAPKSAPQHFSSVANIYLHHTAEPAPASAAESAARVRSDQSYHMDHNGWNDIGYSFVFDPFGQVFEGRGWGVVGAHTLNHNSDGHGFAYLGTGDDPIPDAAQEALRWLIAESDRRYGIRPIHGHREVFATHCPGDWIENNKNAFRGAPGPAPAPAPMPAPTPAPVANHPAWPGTMLHLGSRGPAVGTFQAQLLHRGWNIGAADGDFGPKTDAAVRGFQTEKHLGTDGIVGPATWNAAFELPIT